MSVNIEQSKKCHVFKVIVFDLQSQLDSSDSYILSSCVFLFIAFAAIGNRALISSVTVPLSRCRLSAGLERSRVAWEELRVSNQGVSHLDLVVVLLREQGVQCYSISQFFT